MLLCFFYSQRPSSPGVSNCCGHWPRSHRDKAFCGASVILDQHFASSQLQILANRKVFPFSLLHTRSRFETFPNVSEIPRFNVMSITTAACRETRICQELQVSYSKQRLLRQLTAAVSTPRDTKTALMQRSF
jgi:hypothetical protein